MARIPLITDREQVAPDKRHIADEIMTSRGRIGGPFAAMLYDPEIAGRSAHLGAHIRFESPLTGAQRELSALVAVREFDCAYEWGRHAVQCLEAGVSQQTVDIVGSNGDVSKLGPEEALIVVYTRELLRSKRVSPATFDAARKLLGDKNLTVLTATVGYYVMIACVLNAFEIEPPGGDPPLP